MIVAGFGFRASATVESLSDAFRRASGGRSVDLLSTVDDKAITELFQMFAAKTEKTVVGVDHATLALQRTRTQSTASINARGTGSVAEAAALAAAGPDARLLGPRVLSADRLATCALAQGDKP
ncbi:cobalamin biosynthesis protein [Paracoccus aestuariivivens]|uniref:Precorrin methylase n=1 Tax=Paracoccus aestuariivivens TaxID=1820333 RepID=A0A6L6JCD2_9RHOB|nr:cobalamin biosynthesis protein [Paracoccus aestuariivivens]MTH79772.1 precorrin methylase [Paracoccus aestuariivivens]